MIPSTERLKRTALFEQHVRCGGKMVDFGGWELPVQYAGIIEEHQAVRSKAGLFDVSHMGEISLVGPQALDLLQELVTNDVSVLDIDRVMYTPMCRDDGGIIDDIIIYRTGELSYLLVVNASNTERDFQRILEIGAEFPRAELENISDRTAQLALQGPLAEIVLQPLTGCYLPTLKYFSSCSNVMVAGQEVLLSRTGYTGEYGFEIYCGPEAVPVIWEKLIDTGRPLGLIPAGLGARDTLRFEACLPLYGNELNEETNPLEAGLTRFVKLYKPSFRGRDSLVRMKKEGLKKRLVGLETVQPGIPRTHCPIKKNGQVVGEITSGTFAPTLKKNLGLGYVPPHLAEVGTSLGVQIRSRTVEARVVPIPFYLRTACKTPPS